jgi:hypothetical protein
MGTKIAKHLGHFFRKTTYSKYDIHAKMCLDEKQKAKEAQKLVLTWFIYIFCGLFNSVNSSDYIMSYNTMIKW